MDYKNAADEVAIEVITGSMNVCGESISVSARVGDLGLDSLILSAVIARIEKEYECVFAPTQIVELYCAETIADVLAVVRGVVGSSISV